MNTTPTSKAWVTFPKPNPEASLRLFCFPYAGGNSSIFRTWPNSLLKTVEVSPIELPGRAAQMRLAPFTRLEPLVQTVAQDLMPYLNKPFAFFGHSMGALVSFELTRVLRRDYGISPVHLFVSGRQAPQIPDSTQPIHALPEPEFKEELRRLNGTPTAILENAELMKLILPTLRADFAVIETYIYMNEPPLDCPIQHFPAM